MSLGTFPCPRKRKYGFFVPKRSEWLKIPPPSFLFPRKKISLWRRTSFVTLSSCRRNALAIQFRKQTAFAFFISSFFRTPIYDIGTHTGCTLDEGNREVGRIVFPSPSLYKYFPPWKERVLRSIKGRGIFAPSHGPPRGLGKFGWTFLLSLLSWQPNRAPIIQNDPHESTPYP